MELLITGRDLPVQTLCDAVFAAGPDQREAVLALLDHHDPDVRWAVVSCLGDISGETPTDELVQVAIKLTRDLDKHIRDWACFTLGSRWDVDTAEIRDALAARLDDLDADTRCEALAGLAFRQDPRALPAVRAALSRPSGAVWPLELVAAGCLGDPDLHALVGGHLDGWADEWNADRAAIAYRLTDPHGPGDDVLDGVARMYRTLRAREPDLRWWQLMSAMLSSAPHRTHEFYDGVLERLAGDQAAIERLRDESALGQMAAERPRITRRA